MCQKSINKKRVYCTENKGNGEFSPKMAPTHPYLGRPANNSQVPLGTTSGQGDALGHKEHPVPTLKQLIVLEGRCSCQQYLLFYQYPQLQVLLQPCLYLPACRDGGGEIKDGELEGLTLHTRERLEWKIYEIITLLGWRPMDLTTQRIHPHR